MINPMDAMIYVAYAPVAILAFIVLVDLGKVAADSFTALLEERRSRVKVRQLLEG